MLYTFTPKFHPNYKRTVFYPTQTINYPILPPRLAARTAGCEEKKNLDANCLVDFSA